jgi:hypothetical protein
MSDLPKNAKKVLTAMAKLAPTTETAHDKCTLSAIMKETGLEEGEAVLAIHQAHLKGFCADCDGNLTVQLSDDPKTKQPVYGKADPAIQLHQAGIDWLKGQK